MSFSPTNPASEPSCAAEVNTNQTASSRVILSPTLTGQPDGRLLPPGQALALAAHALAQAAAALGAASFPNPSPVQGQSRSLSRCRLLDAANDFLVAKARAGLSRAYLRQLRWTLAHFCAGRGALTLAELTPALVEEFVSRPQWSNTTRKGLVTDLRTFFSWCQRRGWLERNPAMAVDKPRSQERPPGIHTPEQVRLILATAQSMDRDVMRLLAIQYFAGLRPAEAARLTEADIVPSGYIVVSASKSKTRQRRLVRILPNLSAWLQAGGQLPVVNLTRRFRRVRAAAGIPWPPDVTRHSFASYHLARWRSQDKTATELGHRSSAMLFAHYRELVTPEAAREYFSIRPGD